MIYSLDKPQAAKICCLSKMPGNEVAKNAAVLTSADQYVIVQDGVGKGILENKGDKLNKKTIPSLKCGFLSSKIKADVYWFSKLVKEGIGLYFEAVGHYKDGSPVQLEILKLKFNISIADADVWYKKFIVGPGLKPELHGAIYTKEGLINILKSFASKAVDYAFAEINNPFGPTSLASFHWKFGRGTLDNGRNRLVYNRFKEYMTAQFAALGFKIEFFFEMF